MADEISIRASLRVKKGNLDDQPRPTDAKDDLSVGNGPSPGAVTIPTVATNINLSQLVRPGHVWLCNLDPSNFVEFGIHDGTLFHPLGELRPGIPAVFCFSRNLGEEEDAAGTGTTGVVNAFAMRANTASCIVRIEAFDN